MSTPHKDLDTARLDIWLWRARFFKTRTKANFFIRKGRIRIERNGQTLRVRKPHFALLPADGNVFIKADHISHLEVLEMGGRRGPATEARTLYRILDTQSQLSA